MRRGQLTPRRNLMLGGLLHNRRQIRRRFEQMCTMHAEFGHLKTGHTWSLQNRPTKLTQNKSNIVNAVAVACRDASANSEGWVSARAVAGRALQFRTSDSRLRMPLGQSALGGLSARRGPTRFPR